MTESEEPSCVQPLGEQPVGKSFSKKLPRDFTLILRGGDQVQVSSEVLCWNSSVFGKIVQEMKLKSHEMDDFEYDAVECFIQCLYTGNSKSLSAANFRELYKMSNVFAVYWLIFDCRRFFQNLLDKIKKVDEKLCKINFLYWEADYAYKTRKDNHLLELMKNCVCAPEFGDPAEIINLIIPRCESLNEVSCPSLELLKDIAGKEVEVLAQLLQRCLSVSRYITRNTIFLLDPVILARCLIRDSGSYFTLFETLLGLDTLSREDMKLINKIQLESTRRASNILINKPIKAIDSRMPDPICCRPNFYFSETIKKIDCYSELIKLLKETSAVKNLYMFIDGMHFWMYFQDVSQLIPLWSEEIGQEIIAIRQERRWRKVSKEYIDKLTYQLEPIELFFSHMSKCSELVCSRKSPLSANRSVSVLQLYTEPEIIAFNLPEHAIRKGHASSFWIKSTPLNVPGWNSNPQDIIFEFIAKDASDFKSISSGGETIYPHQMHLRFSITGKARSEPELKDWIPTPPLTWASGLRCYSNVQEDVSFKRFALRWKEMFRNRDIPVVDKTFKGYFMLAFELYF